MPGTTLLRERALPTERVHGRPSGGFARPSLEILGRGPEQSASHHRAALAGALAVGRTRSLSCPVLVARAGEEWQLRGALAGARAGNGRTVLLAGEPGIGKTRLAREVAEIARRQDCTVLTGRSVARRRMTPYRPFAEAIASALRADGLPQCEELRPFRRALGRVVPQLLPDGMAGADESLVFVGEAVLRLLRVLSRDRGCLLVLEDLHWADGETLALLEYVADNLWAERVLCIGTYRTTEGGHAADLAAHLAARGSADVVSLGRLDLSATALMAQACLDDEVLPDDVQSFVAERAEGIPALVEEVLAGLLNDGLLANRGGRWEMSGPLAARVPATFADSVAVRLAAAHPDTRRVMRAASVLGRRFEWTLLSAITGLSDEAVASALRQAVELHMLAADGDGFCFRQALTHEAVLASQLPPERIGLASLALEAVQAAAPELPGEWCTLAADLAERAGDVPRARELLLRAGRRDLGQGALAAAEQALTKASALRAAGDAGIVLDVDQALTEVLAASGQVDRAIEAGRSLLDRIGSSEPLRSADLHLQIAQAAIAGGRWADAEQSVSMARGLAPAGLARADVCAAQIAIGTGDVAEAARLAESALSSAETGGAADVQCDALEVIGRIASQHDLAEAELVFSRAASIALAHGLHLRSVIVMAELGNIDVIRNGSLSRLREARALAERHGALSLTARIDLQIVGPLCKQFRADEALAVASACADLSRRFSLASLPEALLWQAAAHALRGERDEMEVLITEAIEATGPEDVDNAVGCAWGRCRAVLSLLDENLEQAFAEMTTGAELLLARSFAPAQPFLGLWPLVAALLGEDGTGTVDRVRTAHLTRHQMIGDMLGYTEAILAGQAGRAGDAEAALAAVDSQVGPLDEWFRQYARRIAAQAAIRDGWGDPVSWLRESAMFFETNGHDRIAAACRKMLREAGAPVPRRRPGDEALPGGLRAAGITQREADVLALILEGLTNKEIGDRMFLSPRTVEKHVASLLIKTGLRRRPQLAGYLAGIAG